MTLHVLINPARATLAKAVMTPQDTLILGGAAIVLAQSPFPAQKLFALATDCAHWGFSLPDGVTALTDAEWTDHAAAAERIIHW